MLPSGDGIADVAVEGGVNTGAGAGDATTWHGWERRDWTGRGTPNVTNSISAANS